MRPRSLALLWGGVALLCRLPFAARRLWDHDSIQFALGAEAFDLAAHHPHPPGYPLYIGALKALAALGLSPLAGMVLLSALGAALGAACCFLLVHRWSEEASTASLAAALYVSNPLLWFYGELPLIYALEGGVTVALAYLAVAMADSQRSFLLACVAFALAGGLRPSTLVLLFPLFLFGLFQGLKEGRLGWRQVPWGAFAGLVAVAAWLVPLLAAAGGHAAYRELSGGHFETLLPQTSVLYGAGLGALAHNLEVLIKWALQGLVPAFIVLLVAFVLQPRGWIRGLRELWRRTPWLLAWGLPPVLFFALFHVTKAGYTLIHLPALLVASGLLLGAWLRAGRRDVGIRLAITLALVSGAGLFFFGADRRPDQARAWAVLRHEHNLTALRAYERELDEMVTRVQAFDPATTALAGVELAGTGAAGADGFLYSWHRHLQWFLPRYEAFFLAPQAGLVEHTTGGHRRFRRTGTVAQLPDGVSTLLLVLAGLPQERLGLPAAEVLWRGDQFVLLRLVARRPLQLGGLEIRPAPSSAGETPALRDEPEGRRSSTASPGAGELSGGRN
ncbi:MAG: hypothetical protein AAF604_00405 [Acidobacteriota bacterium]